MASFIYGVVLGGNRGKFDVYPENSIFVGDPYYVCSYVSVPLTNLADAVADLRCEIIDSRTGFVYNRSKSEFDSVGFCNKSAGILTNELASASVSLVITSLGLPYEAIGYHGVERKLWGAFISSEGLSDRDTIRNISKGEFVKTCETSTEVVLHYWCLDGRVIAQIEKGAVVKIRHRGWNDDPGLRLGTR